MDQSFVARREFLEKIMQPVKNRVVLSTLQHITRLEELEEMFQQSVQNKEEGLMLKVRCPSLSSSQPPLATKADAFKQGTVRVFDGNVHLRMPLVPRMLVSTCSLPARSSEHAGDQCHSPRASTASNRSNHSRMAPESMRLTCGCSPLLPGDAVNCVQH
jgi:hypothetical protein